MYGVMLIAQYIICYCNKHHLAVSNLKLQKILYFVQAQFLVSKGNPCFPEEIEAWDFGPVVPVVYHGYKIYGSSSIPWNGSGLTGRVDSTDRRLIDNIIDACAKYSAAQLVEITHRQTPWREAYAPYRSRVISKSSIKRYFSEP